MSASGRITIPANLRRRAGLLPGVKVTLSLDGESVRIEKAGPAGLAARGERLIAALRGRGDITLSTDEIMALVRD